MPAPITIRLEERELRAALERLERRVRDLGPAMRGIATELEARVEQRFERRRDPNNSPWEALKDQTLQRKKRKGAILYEHGDLQGSLTSRAGRDFAEVGFGQPYAAYHEFGTRHMPRRGLLLADPVARTLGQGDREAVLDVLRELIEGAL
ncbi:MAG: phage virion morphogenesis protein [Pseudomonadota bacterium]|jgi:phage virion morphogenesis protein